MSFRIFKSSSANLYTYDDILLKLYIDIAGSGDFTKLVKSGKANEAECLSAWESIVRKQEKVTGTNQYNSVLQLLKGYALLLNDHKNIRAALILCAQAPLDWEVLSFLRSKGYEVDQVDAVKRLEDVKNALQKNEKLLTKATMKNNELQRMFKAKDGEKETQSFQEILAYLNVALGFTESENITLDRYNRYQKILKDRARAQEEANKPKR